MLNDIQWRRQAKADDVAQVRQLVKGTGVFSTEEVLVAGELLECYLKEGIKSGYDFLFADYQGAIIAYACFGPIPLTDRRYDLFWIAVQRDYQAKGLGKETLARAERIVADLGGAHLYAEAANRPDNLPTREFYERNRY